MKTITWTLLFFTIAITRMKVVFLEDATGYFIACLILTTFICVMSLKDEI